MTNKYRVYKGFQKQKEKELFDNISDLKKKNVLSVAFMLTVMSSLDGENQASDENPIWVLLADNNISAEEFIEYRDTTFAQPEEIEKIKNYVISEFSYEQKLSLFKCLVYTALLDEEIDDSEAALLSKMEELLDINSEEAAKAFDEILKEKSSLEKIDKNVNKQIELFTDEQKFAIFYTLIIIANSDGITDNENTALEKIAEDLNINIDDYNESNISGEDSINLLKDLNKDQKEAICALITTIVSSDGVFSNDEEKYVRDIIKEYKLPFDFLESLMLKYNKGSNVVKEKEQISTKITIDDSTENEINELESKFCTDCGIEQEGNNFCTECGKNLNEETTINEEIEDFSDDLLDDEGNINDSVRDKMIKLDFTESQRDRGCMYVFLIFKNLNGVVFNDVKIAPQNSYPSLEYYKQMSTGWHFGILSYACLFKSFSDDSYIDEINTLLLKNGFKENNLLVKPSNYSLWKGKGFIIEHIKVNKVNFILISNENVINSERLVASFRHENKEYKELYIKDEISVNLNHIFFIKENIALPKLFGVQLEDLKDIHPPVKTNKEILIGSFDGSILPYTEEQLLNGIATVEFLHFRNLKGIVYHDIKFPKPPSGNPEDFFNQDPDGSWYFTVMNFSMLFKSFSDETFDDELNKLLTANNFEIENKISENSRDYWVGDNFNIEIPKTFTSNLIIISNESITNKDSSKIRETNLTEITHDFKWINGFTTYDYQDFSNNQSDALEAINVPLYFELPDENEGSIVITVPTENIGRSIINNIINENGGDISFRSAEHEEWTNLYNGYEFVIGYFPERDHVRINQLPPLNAKSIDHELRMRMWKFDEAFYMDKYDMDESEVEMEYWYGVILSRCTGLGGKEFAKKQNKDPQLLMLEYIHGHAEEYTVKHSDKSFEDKKIICLMRILCFGYIYKTLFEHDKKLDEFIEKNKFNDEDYKEDILFRLLHAKASVYGTIKFALASNISEDEIREWFPSVEFDEGLIEGVDPMSSYM